MGTERKTFSIYASVSRHNSAQDDEDNSRWDELVGRFEMIAAEHRYENLRIDTM